MSDIFARLAARATGQSPARAELRTVPFESAAAAAGGDRWLSGSSAEPPGSAADPDPGEPHSRSSAIGDQARARRGRGTSVPTGPARTSAVGTDAAPRAGPPVRDDQPSDARETVAAVRESITALARHLSPPPAQSQDSSVGAALRSVRPSPAPGGHLQGAAGPPSGATRSAGAEPQRAASGAAGRAAGATVRQPAVTAASRSHAIRSAFDEAVKRPATTPTSPPGSDPTPEPAPAPSALPATGAEPNATAAAGRVLPPEMFLRDHLGPALARLGAIAERELPALVPISADAPGRPPRAGAIAVGVDPVELPAGAEVHVHIERVQIVREQPAPSSAAPNPGRGAPDHAAYLARQQGRWRR